MVLLDFSPARLALGRRMTKIGMALRERLPESPSSRPAILYVHGLGESAFCFEGLLASPRLAEWHQLAPDLLGYGKSLWTADPYVLEGHARALGRMLDELEIGPVVLVGHSMGGVIATHFARLLKRRTAALINVEGNISLADCHFSGRVAAMPLEQWLASGFAAFLEQLYSSAALPPSPASDAPEILRAYGASVFLGDPRQMHRNSIDLVETSRRGNLAREMAALEIPSLYVYGAPRGTGEHSRSLLAAAGVPMLEISSAGHWCYLDQQEAFIDGMLELLGRLEA
jgi:pimeloyl-ACP methyl ester carboxylesterase